MTTGTVGSFVALETASSVPNRAKVGTILEKM